MPNNDEFYLNEYQTLQRIWHEHVLSPSHNIFDDVEDCHTCVTFLNGTCNLLHSMSPLAVDSLHKHLVKVGIIHG